MKCWTTSYYLLTLNQTSVSSLPTTPQTQLDLTTKHDAHHQDLLDPFCSTTASSFVCSGVPELLSDISPVGSYNWTNLVHHLLYKNQTAPCCFCCGTRYLTSTRRIIPGRISTHPRCPQCSPSPPGATRDGVFPQMMGVAQREHTVGDKPLFSTRLRYLCWFLTMFSSCNWMGLGPLPPPPQAQAADLLVSS